MASMCMMFPAQKRLARNGISFLTCGSRPWYRRMLLPARYSEARLGSRRAMLGHPRPGRHRLSFWRSLWRLLGPSRLYAFPRLRCTLGNSRPSSRISARGSWPRSARLVGVFLSSHCQPRLARRHDRRRPRRRLFLPLQQYPLLSSVETDPRLAHRRHPLFQFSRP